MGTRLFIVNYVQKVHQTVPHWEVHVSWAREVHQTISHWEAHASWAREVHQTVPHWEAHASWARDYIKYTTYQKLGRSLQTIIKAIRS